MLKNIFKFIISFLFISLIVMVGIFANKLFNGIKIDSLTYNGIVIKQLYIKYDKKLILDANIFLTSLKLTLKSTTVPTFKTEGKILKIKNFSLKFNPNIEPIKISDGYIAYENKELTIHINKGICNGVKLFRSDIIIDKYELLLLLHSHNLLDKNLDTILRAYHTVVPLKQLAGNNDLFTSIAIPFSPEHTKIKVILKATKTDFLANKNIDIKSSKLYFKYKDHIINVKANSSTIKYDNIVLRPKKLNVNIKNDIVLVKSDDINISANNTDIFVKNTKLKYDKNIVVSNSNIIFQNQKFQLQNYLDIDKKRTKGEVIFHNSNNKDIYIVNNKPIHYNVDFNTTIKVDIPEFLLHFQKQNSLNKVSIKNLDNILQYTKFSNIIDTNTTKLGLNITYDQDTNITKGIINVDLFKYDTIVEIKKEKYDFIANINKKTLTIPKLFLKYKYSNNTHDIYLNHISNLAKYITFVDIPKNKDSKIHIYTKDNFKNINILGTNMDIVVKNIPKLQESEDNNSTTKTNIKLYDGFIKYTDNTIFYDSVIIDTQKDKMILKYKYKKNKFTLNKNKDRFNIPDGYFTDTFITKIAKQKKLIKGGYITVKVDGIRDNIKGRVDFHKTLIQDISILNKLIIFINTTPAIINPLLALPTLYRMSDDKYSSDGYFVKKGYATFRYNTKTKDLNIDDAYTRGLMMDFKAKAKVDFKDSSVSSKVDVVFLKDYSNAINMVPVVGYIITGEDGNFHTTIDIDGNLTDPTFETHTLKNTASGIFGVIKRIVTLPIKAFEMLDSNSSTPQEAEENKKIVDQLIDPSY